MNSSIPILVEDLNVTLGGSSILKEISFHISSGEFLFLVGPNGAGKSTLLKSLCGIQSGIQKGSAGKVELFGRSIDNLSSIEIAKTLAYLPQNFAPAFACTVRDLVESGRFPHLGKFRSSFQSRDHEVVDQALELSELTAFSDRSLHDLSGGELQRALIASALAQEAKVLLLDESTSALDPRYHDEIFALILNLTHQQKISVILVSHDLNAGAMAASKVLALRGGKQFFFGSCKTFMNEGVLSNLYGRAFNMMEHPSSGIKLVVPRVYEEADKNIANQ